MTKFAKIFYMLMPDGSVQSCNSATYEREFPKRRVDRTTIGDAEISTVFLGLDHNYSNVGPPLLFETMVFGGEHDGYQERCSTKAEAQEMHMRIVMEVTDGTLNSTYSG